MQITVNDIDFEVPFDISQISLSKFIEYREQYGIDLDKKLAEILERKSELTDPDEVALNLQIDLDNHIDNEALAWFSFWTNSNLFEVKNHPSIPGLLESYRVLRFLIKESMDTVYEFPSSITWQGEQWTISDFKVNPSSAMTFNEIITSKEVTRQIYKVGKGKWEALPYLCAVFLRKKDESFSDEFIHEDSDRLELFKELPLFIALQVAFFLSICVTIWSRSLVFSRNQEEVKPSQN